MKNHESELLELLKEGEALQTDDTPVQGVTPHAHSESDVCHEEKPTMFSPEAAKRMRQNREQLLQQYFSTKVETHSQEKTASETLLEKAARVVGHH